jgi:hypothetical protein
MNPGTHASRRQPGPMIDIESDNDLRNWAEALDVSEEELLRAVKAVGPSSEAVREYLGEEE